MSGFWRERPTFVTGATGFLGRWLVKRLVDEGADVVCLVRDSLGSRIVPDDESHRVRVVRGEVTDQALIHRTLGENGIDTVLHLAAQAIVGTANRDPVATFETNVRGTWCLLEACRRSPKVQQIVVASSDKAYGEQPNVPFVETMPLQGRYPYELSKTCADLIALGYAKSFGLPIVETRCGNYYGGGDLNWNRIVPGTIRSILQGESPLIRSDGTFVRDYFYVDDGAIATMLLAERLASDRTLSGEAFNFSNEIPLKSLDIVHLILARMRSSLTPIVLNETSNETHVQFLSAAKARERLNWRPEFTLETALDHTISWYRSYLRNL